jgi:uncharacterized protein YxjI
VLDTLLGARKLLVRQVKEWSEILLGYEARNHYEVLDEGGRVVARVAEEGSGFGRWLGRQFLGRCRRATLHVMDPRGGELARIEKPFRWYFHQVELVEDGRPAGRIVRRFTIFTDRFALLGADGRELISIERGFLNHFRFRGTFKVTMSGLEVARITKEWRGLLTEWFTDADLFGVEFLADDLDPAVKSLLFAATFLIDFACFEQNQRRGGLLDVVVGGD